MAPKVGDHVRYVDELGEPREALVTRVNEDGERPSLNLVLVSKDEERTDSYGRQVERETSAVHREHQGAEGRYWLAP